MEAFDGNVFQVNLRETKESYTNETHTVCVLAARMCPRIK